MSMFKSLLTRLSIQNVYWIDDDNAPPEDIDTNKLVSEFVILLIGSDADQRKSALGPLKANATLRPYIAKIESLLEKDSDGDSVDGVENLLLEAAGKIDDIRALLLNAMTAINHPLGKPQREAIEKVFGGVDGCNFKSLSFSSWQKQEKEILKKSQDDQHNSLLIVDLQNDREQSPTSGKDVLTAWSTSSDAKRNVYAVALTNKFKQTEEISNGRKLAIEIFGENAAQKLPILVLSKDRLSVESETPSDSALNAFQAALGRVRTYELHNILSELLQTLFENATQNAFNELRELSFEEFLYAVSTSSFEEGASEVDTLIRLISIAHRQSLLGALVSRDEVRQLLIELRGLYSDGHGVKKGDVSTNDGIKRLRYSELYDDADWVNASFSPVSTGDIFEIEDPAGSKQQFVVVSNACDLTLRGDNGIRKLQDALLLEIVPYKVERKAELIVIGDFPKASNLPNGILAVHMNRAISLPLIILDLCFTNNAGECTWTRQVSDPVKKSIALIPAQDKRINIISKAMTSVDSLEKAKQCAPTLPPAELITKKANDAIEAAAKASADESVAVEPVAVELVKAVAAEPITAEVVVTEAVAVVVTGAVAAFAAPVAAEASEAVTVAADDQIAKIKFPIKRIGRLSSNLAANVVRKFAQNIARHIQEHDYSEIE